MKTKIKELEQLLKDTKTESIKVILRKKLAILKANKDIKKTDDVEDME